jgi:hypothetical protein
MLSGGKASASLAMCSRSVVRVVLRDLCKIYEADGLMQARGQVCPIGRSPSPELLGWRPTPISDFWFSCFTTSFDFISFVSDAFPLTRLSSTTSCSSSLTASSPITQQPVSFSCLSCFIGPPISCVLTHPHANRTQAPPLSCSPDLHTPL